MNEQEQANYKILFDDIKHSDEDNVDCLIGDNKLMVEFWLARELIKVLQYN